MKIQRTICIELENWLLLKQNSDNCSSVINDLVANYLKSLPKKDIVLDTETKKDTAEQLNILKTNQTIIIEQQKPPIKRWGESIF